MQDETKRLETFTRWPHHSPVTAADLARAGFFYTGDGDRVICDFCNLKLENWEIEDIPEEEHRRHSPNCQFILNPHHIGNLPYSQQVYQPQVGIGQQEEGQVHGQPVEEQSGHQEMGHSQPLTGHPQLSLGLQEYGQSRGHLTSSGQQVGQPEGEQEESQEYEDPFENNPLYVGVLQETVTQHVPLVNQQVKYSTYEERLTSYPNDWKKPEKEKMADSGFYFKGGEDNVQCYSCKESRCNWSGYDDPYKEHQSACVHLMQIAQKRQEKKFLEEKLGRTQSDVRVINPPKKGAGDANQPSYITKDIPCIQCKQKPRSVLFQNCKHFVVCYDCSKKLPSCPVCHINIKSK